MPGCFVRGPLALGCAKVLTGCVFFMQYSLSTKRSSPDDGNEVSPYSLSPVSNKRYYRFCPKKGRVGFSRPFFPKATEIATWIGFGSLMKVISMDRQVL